MHNRFLSRCKSIGVTNRRSIPRYTNKNRFFSSSNQKEEYPTENAATIVQGPSLLTDTGHARPSPSLFLLPGLRSLPFWTAPHQINVDSKEKRSKLRVAYNDPTVSKIVQHLEDNFETILDEYRSSVLGVQSSSSPIITSSSDLDQMSQPNISPSLKMPLQPDYDLNSKGIEHSTSKSESLHEGQWDWHSYIQNGKRSLNFQSHCPKTSRVIDEIGSQHLFADIDSQGSNPFGFCFFSTLSGQSNIKAHCGPMNLRLRIHLPLIVPMTELTSHSPQEIVATESCGLRVGKQTRQWIPGKAVVLDDSYEHEVWNKTMEPRVLLLVDIWHPDVLQEEKQRLLQMFDFAKGQGWMGNK